MCIYSWIYTTVTGILLSKCCCIFASSAIWLEIGFTCRLCCADRLIYQIFFSHKDHTSHLGSILMVIKSINANMNIECL